VSLTVTFVLGLGVDPQVPSDVKTLGEFSDWAKANPDKASCSHPGALPHAHAGQGPQCTPAVTYGTF